MKIVVDANILFSALVKDSVTRAIWLNPRISLLAPQFIVSEYAKYRDYLATKYAGPVSQLDLLAEKLLKYVEIVPNEELVPFIPAALTLTKDKADVLYLACALKKDAQIWTQDKGFQAQKRVKIKTTAELLRELGSI